MNTPPSSQRLSEASVRALSLARKIHATDFNTAGPDAGKPWVETHTLRVMLSVPEDCQPIAALHDSLISYTNERFRKGSYELLVEGVRRGYITQETLDGVILLTPNRNERFTPEEYFLSLINTGGKLGEKVRRVKFAEELDDYMFNGRPNGDDHIAAIASLAEAISADLGIVTNRYIISRN